MSGETAAAGATAAGGWPRGGGGDGREDPVAVLGAGSFGTALALQLARAGNRVRLWGRDPEALARMRAEGRNARYLPDAPFPDALVAEPDLGAALEGVRAALVVVPSHALRTALEALDAAWTLPRAERALGWATKGLEAGSGLLPHQVVREAMPGCAATAVLSGPTFATEIAAGLPTAITVAASEEAVATIVAGRLASPRFRPYTSTDVVGVETGGAVKNAIAIAAGVSDGLGYGANARVALITRGLAEMRRFGEALGARPETFAGLACMGDLVLTCTDDQSRNRRFGLALAAGRGVEEAIRAIGQTVEGATAAGIVHAAAAALGVDMPIVSAVHRVLGEGLAPEDAVAELMGRPGRGEG